MAVDASALVAIAQQEPGYQALELALSSADVAFATSINIMEAGLVLVLREARFTTDSFRAWLEAQNVTETQAVDSRATLDAYLRWAKACIALD